MHHLAMVFAGFKGRADLVRRLPPREAKGAKLELPLMIACEKGNEAFWHAECVRVLLRGGRRWGEEKEEGRRRGRRGRPSEWAHEPDDRPPDGARGVRARNARGEGGRGSLEALRWSSSLHFVGFNSYEWTRALLRCGADVHTRLGTGSPTPVDVARMTLGASSSLVLRASLPWSPETHDLFPLPARRRAADLLLVGRMLASPPPSPS